MFRGVLMGDSLLALLLARALVASGRCGAEAPPVAASFPASWVAPGVSVVGWVALGLDVMGFPTLVENALKGRWC